MGNLTDGTEKHYCRFVLPFVDQTDKSDTKQSGVCRQNIGKERMGTSELKKVF